MSRLRESLKRYHLEDTMGLVVRSRCQVEKEVVDFLTNLLQGYHCTPDLLGASPFKPDFTYLK